MAKSKFFGYVLRNAGTPCQQWVLNEIPTTVTSVFTSTTTSSVAINGTNSGSVIGDTVIRSSGCGINFAIVNSSTTNITPVMAGTESVRVIITKIV